MISVLKWHALTMRQGATSEIIAIVITHLKMRVYPAYRCIRRI
jgi:hypothetical protein